MSEQENVKVALAGFEAWNSHDLSKFDPLEAENIQVMGPGAPGPMNKEQSRMYNQGYLTAFPDIHFDVTLTIAQGDHVVVHWTGTGTHTGPMRTPSGSTIPPTGKKGVVSGSSTFEIKNGKIVRGWNFWDMTTLLGQLGLMPSM